MGGAQVAPLVHGPAPRPHSQAGEGQPLQFGAPQRQFVEELSRDLDPGLGFMAVVDFATSDFETCPKYQNWANFINKSTT